MMLLLFLNFRNRGKAIFTVILRERERERQRPRERERTLSTLRPGCIYYTLIVEEEVLWRAVLSLERVEGLWDIKSIFVYQALSEKHCGNCS